LISIADDRETRTRQIDTLLEIEKIKDTIQQIKDDQKIVSISITEKERVLPNISNLESELEEAQEKLHQTRNSLHAKQNILNEVEKEFDLAKQRLKVSEQEKITAENLNRDIERITEKKENLKKQLSDELGPEKHALEKLQSEFQALENRLTEFENVKVSLADFDEASRKYRQKQDFSEKLRSAQIQLQQQQSLIAKAQTDKYPLEVECLNAIEEELNNIRDALEQERFERDELKEQSHAIVNAIQKVNSNLEEKSRLEVQLKTLQHKISQLRDQYAKLKEEAQNLKAKQQDLNRVQSSFNRLLQQESQLLTERKRRKEDLTYAKTHREEIIKQGKDSSCPQCKRPYGENYQDILTSYEREIADLATELNKLEEAIRSDTLAKKSETEKVKQLQTEVGMLNRTAGTVGIVRKTIANFQRDTEQINQRLKTLHDELEVLWNDFQDVAADSISPQDFLANLTSQSHEIQESISEMEYSIFSYEEELDEKESLMTSQIERVHKLESLLDQINIHQQREAEIRASINEFEGNLAEIGDINYDESAHTECKKKYEALTKDYERSLVLKEQLKRLPIVQKRISDAICCQ